LTGFIARAAVAAARGPDGATRITRLRSDGPLALRIGPASVVYLVGAAGGPLGGDDLELDISVGPGAELVIRSAAASLALPGRSPSRFTVRATVAAAGTLDYAPEPTIAVRGCDHLAATSLSCEDGARIRWRDELVLGRHGEPPGRHTGRIDVTYAGIPLLRHELRIGDFHTCLSVLGDAKAIGTLLLAGPGHAVAGSSSDGLAILPLAGPGTLVTALGRDALEMHKRLLDNSST
jgi:urease accessory protein